MGMLSPFLIVLCCTFSQLLLLMETPNFADALSDGEMCEQCQKVLYRTFLYYRVQTTKRLLKHKLKHLCKRYFEYRRHCLITMLPRVDLIWENMEKTLNEDRTAEFQPYGTCAAMKECDKDHQPLATFGHDDINGGGVAGGAAATLGIVGTNAISTSSTSSSDSLTTTVATTTTTDTTSSSWSTPKTTTTDEPENEAVLMLDFMF